MSALERLRLHYSRDSVADLRRVRQRFLSTPQRPERLVKSRGIRRLPVVPVLAVLGAALLYLVLTNAAPQLAILARDDVTWLPNVTRDDVAFYRNCDAARAAGAAPIYYGQPGYRPALDRDNDGIACEPLPQAMRD